MHRLRLAAGIGFALLLTTPTAAPAEQPATLELTGLVPTVHPSPEPPLLPWSPNSTAESSGFDWRADHRSLNLTAARLTLPLGSCELIAQADRMPSLFRFHRAVALFWVSGDEPAPMESRQSDSTRLEAFDLGLGIPLAPSESLTVTPWVGLSQVRTVFDERWIVRKYYFYAGEGGDLLPFTSAATRRIDGRFLGLVAGADVRWDSGAGRWLSLRGLARWVGGKESVRYSTLEYVGAPEEPPPDAEPTLRRASRESTRLIFAVEAAFGVQVTKHASVAMGWLFHDYSDKGGPARISGPFLRAVLTF